MKWLRMRVVIFRSNMIINSRNNDYGKLRKSGVVMFLAAVVTVVCINLLEK